MKARHPAGLLVAFLNGGYGVDMVSMYVDIRQAAELLAKVTGTHPTHQAQQISLAGQFHGLEFRGPGQTLWQWRPSIFTTATGDDGKVYVRPAGAYKGERRKTLQAIRGEAETDESADNELVTPYFKVSLADIVRNPFFRFDAEIKEQILEAHKAAAVVLPPADDVPVKDVVPIAKGTVVHSTKTRRNVLKPVIEQAQKLCTDSKDTAEVWAKLQTLADEKTPPLIGATEDGLQYLKNGCVAFLNRDSLRKRLSRQTPISAAMRR